jgi:hypothetical protein
VPSSGITDRVTGWSTDITRWIEEVGSVRIAVAVTLLLAAVVVAVRAVRTGGASGEGPNGDGGQGASRSTRQPDAAEASRR